jgi:CRISPR-associated protein Cas1
MKSRNVKIELGGFGELLGREKGCLVVKDRKGKHKRYPLFENAISEIQIRTGNLVSSGALATCAFWNVNVIILTQYGNPIAILKSLNDDDHVRTRICQYEALKNGKGLEAAKQIVLCKIRGQNELLKKYGLRWLDYYPYSQAVKAIEDKDITRARARLMSYEGRFSEQYFRQIFALFNEAFRPERRKTFKAYDGVNNVFNLTYEMLSWKVHHALIKAKLEPYLGFLHSIAEGKPSLICDFMELYRYLIDDFVIQYCQELGKNDFIMKFENYSANRKGKREFLNDSRTKSLVKSLGQYFKNIVAILRMRMGKHQEIETLICEEALLLAQYLRNEKQTWIPRIAKLD